MNLDTPRLHLREWRESDKAPFFSEINSSPEVMRYFPCTLSQLESDNMVEIIREKFIQQNGWGMWAVELKETQEFIGFVGLNIPVAPLPFNPCVEIGWRIAKKFWRKGYTYEAALAVFKFAFEILALDEVVAFTAMSNLPSQGVMQKLGMHQSDNFFHPALEKTHPLAEHVLYRMKKSDFTFQSNE
ncbi:MULTISPECIES: GNAT family N-acetyltransferase [Enterobacterales]|uniref:GNAT family N-acetyltransferase n=1 Tax=Enterobacterales TaxID=91347 RepID=UPI0008481A3B|nr:MULTISPECIES: GNAT family N-acetyltransferase [Enterobacterales]WOO48815.1 GNAT family N-acetyltransferase [Hafnia alvei]MCK9780496.1 GNAT family N-acetyltransferase [Proteus columbae]MCT6518840.1 GNAT family N-acetyltransferase [Proteus vulgaris]ODQ07013.1 GNAT family N-acetyltransferase [Shigella sp. FC130]OEI94408.1 GNAT family N-acetyltransferase [Shigella sp. FC1655]